MLMMLYDHCQHWCYFYYYYLSMYVLCNYINLYCKVKSPWLVNSLNKCILHLQHKTVSLIVDVHLTFQSIIYIITYRVYRVIHQAYLLPTPMFFFNNKLIQILIFGIFKYTQTYFQMFEPPFYCKLFSV